MLAVLISITMQILASRLVICYNLSVTLTMSTKILSVCNATIPMSRMGKKGAGRENTRLIRCNTAVATSCVTAYKYGFDMLAIKRVKEIVSRLK